MHASRINRLLAIADSSVVNAKLPRSTTRLHSRPYVLHTIPRAQNRYIISNALQSHVYLRETRAPSHAKSQSVLNAHSPIATLRPLHLIFTSPTLHQRLEVRLPSTSTIPFYMVDSKSARVSFGLVFHVLELRRKVLENGSPLRCIIIVITPTPTLGSALGKLAHTISGLPDKRRYP